jgi:hypothetical protein
MIIYWGQLTNVKQTSELVFCADTQSQTKFIIARACEKTMLLHDLFSIPVSLYIQR